MACHIPQRGALRNLKESLASPNPHKSKVVGMGLRFRPQEKPLETSSRVINRELPRATVKRQNKEKKRNFKDTGCGLGPRDIRENNFPALPLGGLSVGVANITSNITVGGNGPGSGGYDLQYFARGGRADGWRRQGWRCGACFASRRQAKVESHTAIIPHLLRTVRWLAAALSGGRARSSVPLVFSSRLSRGAALLQQCSKVARLLGGVVVAAMVASSWFMWYSSK